MLLPKSPVKGGLWTALTLASPAAAQVNFSTTNFAGAFASGSGVLQSLRPVLNPSFDFSPSDVFALRNEPGQYHTGDLTLRYRLSENGSEWLSGDTAAVRHNSTTVPGLGAASLDSALPGVEGLNVTRTWSEHDGDLTLAFTIENIASSSIELGSVGMPIEFNNIFTGRTAVETREKCVLVDPYTGLNAGYAQVTRLTGTGPSLVITPLNRDSKFEAWRFLDEPTDGPLGYQIQTYEGNYAWEVFSKAYAENEWNSTEPWNTPTSTVVEPNGSITVGLRFSVANGVQEIEDTVAKADIPVAVGIPGYVLQHDLNGKLFLNTTKSLTGITTYPSSSLSLTQCGTLGKTWTAFEVNASPSAFGRVRLELHYANNITQAIQYWIAHPGPTAISKLGSFLTNEQWYTNTSDPFGRAPSVITYDRSVNDYVLQDNRTWIAGLSDEGGAGSFLAAGMKQSVAPDAAEVAKLEEMVHEVVWGRLQISRGNQTYAVRKSLFYYQPDLVPGYEYDPFFNWTINPGESWDKEAAYLIDRTYDYVHVSALYWGLYRAGRTHPDMLKRESAHWYLQQAYHTVNFGCSNSSDGAPHTDYVDVGLMGEWVWGELLSDLKADGLIAEAANMEALMRVRQSVWSSEADPFGSEMAWDSTGEEGVYYWSQYFNDSATAQKSINAIRGYMPTIAHWGYNGNARRYWDFLYAGSIELARIERQIHHYGSGLNALPMLANYRASSNPGSLDAIYDLRVGYGGNQGPLSNMDIAGFGSMAFHSYPDTMHWDAYSGDYGPNFLGLVSGAATYLVDHPVFGWLSFGGNLQEGGNDVVTVEPRDAVRQRIFVAPLSLYVTIDSGVIERFGYNTTSNEVWVRIAGRSAGVDRKNLGYGRYGGDAGQIIMSWEQTAESACRMRLATRGLVARLGGFVVHPTAGRASTVTFEMEYEQAY